MPIDDPISAVQQQIENDTRRDIPSARIVTEIVGNLPDPFGALLRQAFQRLDIRRAENTEYLLNIVANEVRELQTAIDQRDDNAKRFREEELPGLMLDAVKKASDVRARDRIARLGKILACAMDAGTPMTADETEELLRIAVDLSEVDVTVLRQLDEAQRSILKYSNGRPLLDKVSQAWRNARPKVSGLLDGDIQSICAKLQSFGLAVRMERNNSELGPDEIPYALLPRGVRFIDAIRGLAVDEPEADLKSSKNASARAGGGTVR